MAARNRTTRYEAPRAQPARTIAAHVYDDVVAAVDAYARAHGLQRSGAVHHLLRLSLDLDPIRPVHLID